jgi:hypothetical protein
LSDTLFKKVDYSLAKLMDDIEMGTISLPDIQRPFVWKNSKIRDLFDLSCCRGPHGPRGLKPFRPALIKPTRGRRGSIEIMSISTSKSPQFNLLLKRCAPYSQRA